MAQTRQDRIKEIVFLVFVGISLVMVLLVWVDGLRADVETVPGYYRTVDTGSGSTATSEPTEMPAEAGAHTSDGALDHGPPQQQHDPLTPTPTRRHYGDEDF